MAEWESQVPGWDEADLDDDDAVIAMVAAGAPAHQTMGGLRTALAAQFLAVSLSKSIAGSSDVTLTDAETMASPLILTGATQAIGIIVPTGQSVSVVNDGNYDLTIKRSGASGTLPLLSGDRMEVLA